MGETNGVVERPPRVALLGAAPGTGNLGVDALGAAALQGLLGIAPDAEVLFQNWTNDPVDLQAGSRQIRCEPLVIRRQSSMRRPDGVTHLRRLAAMRDRLGPRLSGPVAGISTSWRRLRSCDLVFDLSAGDSFADIYGEEVFWYQTQLKLLCLDMGIPLVLLPQTIGPFSTAESKRTAADILRRCALVCTREVAGIEEVRGLCGDRGPERLVHSPDLALRLESAPTELPSAIDEHRKTSGGSVICVNVSGLLYFERRSFGLAAPHRDVSIRLVRWALAQEDTRVLLVPHVVPVQRQAPTAKASSDSTDSKACDDLLSRLTPEERCRVDTLVGADHPSRAKYAMSGCDFFVGARMHAFIGAASQGTPAALLAYSKKAASTCQTIGAEDLVVDLRSLDADAVLAAVDECYRNREAIAQRLASTMPEIKARIDEFFQAEIAPLIGVSDPGGRETPPDPLHADAAFA